MKESGNGITAIKGIFHYSLLIDSRFIYIITSEIDQKSSNEKYSVSNKKSLLEKVTLVQKDFMKNIQTNFIVALFFKNL